MCLPSGREKAATPRESGARRVALPRVRLRRGKARGTRPKRPYRSSALVVGESGVADYDPKATLRYGREWLSSGPRAVKMADHRGR